MRRVPSFFARAMYVSGRTGGFNMFQPSFSTGENLGKTSTWKPSQQRKYERVKRIFIVIQLRKSLFNHPNVSKITRLSQTGRWIQHTCHLSWCVKREVTWERQDSVENFGNPGRLEKDDSSILAASWSLWERWMQLEKCNIPSWIRMHKECILKLNEWQPATILGCLIDFVPLRCNFGYTSKNSLTTAFSGITFANSFCSDRLACPDPSSCWPLH